MINGSLEQFLDTGWRNEAEIYYRHYIYWCEGDELENGEFHFFVRKWKAKNIGDESYVTLTDESGSAAGYDDSFSIICSNEDEAREQFLKAKIWDGKSFWEVEKELAWLDYSGRMEVDTDCDDKANAKEGRGHSRKENM